MTSRKDIILQDNARPCTAGHAFGTGSAGPSSGLHAPPSPSQASAFPLRHQANQDQKKALRYLRQGTATCGERCTQQERRSALAALRRRANTLQQARAGGCHLKGLPLAPVKTARAARHPTHSSQLLQHRQAVSPAIPARFGLGGNSYTRTTKLYLTSLRAQTS